MPRRDLTYPGNSQGLLEVLSPNQPEPPGSGTLQRHTERHGGGGDDDDARAFNGADGAQGSASDLCFTSYCTAVLKFEADYSSTALAEGEDPPVTVGRIDFEVSSLISERPKIVY